MWQQEQTQMSKTAFARVDRALAKPPLHTESSLVSVCCQALGLSLAESRLFVVLLKFDHATKADLHRALAPNGGPVPTVKAVGVTVHFLRRKLAPFGVEVINTYGVGYRLAQGARDRTRKLLATYGKDIVEAVTLPAAPSD
jgi:DNA-binding response OmpR family regulator